MENFRYLSDFSLTDVTDLEADELRQLLSAIPPDRLVDHPKVKQSPVELTFPPSSSVSGLLAAHGPTFECGVDDDDNSLKWHVQAQKGDDSNISVFLCRDDVDKASAMDVEFQFSMGTSDDVLKALSLHTTTQAALFHRNSMGWGRSNVISASGATTRGLLKDDMVSLSITMSFPKHSTQLGLLIKWCEARTEFRSTGSPANDLCSLLQCCEKAHPGTFDDVLLFHAAGTFSELARAPGFAALPASAVARLVARADLARCDGASGGALIEEAALVELLAPWAATRTAPDVARVLAGVELRELAPEQLRAFVAPGGCLAAFKHEPCIADLLAAAIEARLRAKRAAEDRRLHHGLACPITQELMVDPVICMDGHTSPKTNLALPSKTLIPNHAIKAQICELRDREHEALPGPRAKKRARVAVVAVDDDDAATDATAAAGKSRERGESASMEVFKSFL